MKRPFLHSVYFLFVSSSSCSYVLWKARQIGTRPRLLGIPKSIVNDGMGKGDAARRAENPININ